jgi:WXG100 family type VII secretion target
MSSISATNQSFDRATGHLREAAGTLHQDQAAIDDRVRTFLDAGWTGIAATAFVEAWEEWKAAADDVETGLAAMAQLIGAAQKDFNVQDASSQAALDALSAKIIARLG